MTNYTRAYTTDDLDRNLCKTVHVSCDNGCYMYAHLIEVYTNGDFSFLPADTDQHVKANLAFAKVLVEV